MEQVKLALTADILRDQLKDMATLVKELRKGIAKVWLVHGGSCASSTWWRYCYLEIMCSVWLFVALLRPFPMTPSGKHSYFWTCHSTMRSGCLFSKQIFQGIHHSCQWNNFTLDWLYVNTRLILPTWWRILLLLRRPVDSASVRLFTPSTPEHRVRRQLFPSATPSPAGSSQGNGTDASA